MAITTTSKTSSAAAVTVDRRSLKSALDRVGGVISRRSPRPILEGVRLDAAAGVLRLSATDGEVAITVQVPAEGDLPACLIPCAELMRRVRAAKAPTCTLAVQPRKRQLVLDSGEVRHALHLLDLKEYPPMPDRADAECGPALELKAADLGRGLATARKAASREPSRYAIDGVLLESDAGGARLAATDGRRLVIIELDRQSDPFEGRAILPRRLAVLLGKLIGRDEEASVRIVIQTEGDNREKTDGDHTGAKPPATVHVAGPDWYVSTQEAEGRFPDYREVVPETQSRFVVDRLTLVEALRQVALAAGPSQPAVRLDLGRRSIRLSAETPEVGRSEAVVRSTFAGGGDDCIQTGFAPGFLMDALKHLSADRVVIDVAQNTLGLGGRVRSHAALLHGEDDPKVRWVVMPIDLGLEPSRESLGSNHREEDQAA